jgi:hypothetical protein
MLERKEALQQRQRHHSSERDQQYSNEPDKLFAMAGYLDESHILFFQSIFKCKHLVNQDTFPHTFTSYMTEDPGKLPITYHQEVFKASHIE